MKKILVLAALAIKSICVNAQEDTISKKKFFNLGKEKSGRVCVNGLEKLEIAATTDKSFMMVNQLHFYAPGPLEGRLFMQAEEERSGRVPVRFFEASADITYKEFPIHIGYSMGLDQIGKKPNVTYSGLSLTSYWSDIHSVHKYFHIFRTGVSYQSLSEHLTSLNREDSTVSAGKHIEYSMFFQLQPIHITHRATIFSEGLFRMRGENSFIEYELGLRHEKVFEDLLGLGLRFTWEDFKFHSIAGVLRFNISNPNPKHI